MSREIKYRGFCFVKKEMIYNIDISPMLSHAVLTKSFDFEEMVAEVKILNIHIDDAMQFTGLKDKNGLEIYDGDILSKGFYGGFLEGKRIPCLLKVVWHEKSASFRSIEIYDDEVYPWIDAFNSEVVGNIYENPELLEKPDER